MPVARRLIAAVATATAIAAGAGPAQAAGPRPAPTVDLSGYTAEQRVVDTVMPDHGPRARAAAARTETFVDQHGHTIRIATDLLDYDLAPVAGVLAAARHGDELEALRVEVGLLRDAEVVCGSPDAVACYGPDDADTLPDGEMWIAADDTDLVHTIVHEYGHHTDNQLLNLRHLDPACPFHGDGSRNWFFEREIEDRILDAGVTCDIDAEWEFLLAELFAEDFVALHGIGNWVLGSVGPPTQGELDALEFDIANPFRTRDLVWRPRLRTRRTRTNVLELEHWTFAEIRLRGPRGSDSDLALFEAGERRPFASRTGPGRRERIRRLLPPGVYEVAVRAYRGSGRARVRAVLD